MPARVSSPAFVGRRHELDAAMAGLARARDGHPAVVLVAGEAGVGKTRFVAEVASQARHDGFRVLEGGCVPLGHAGLPLAPIIEATHGLAREIPLAELHVLAGSGRAELSRLIPELASEPQAGRQSVDPSAPGRLVEHFLRLLERLAVRAPLLVVLEDLHWADSSTLDLLSYLVRNLRDVPIVVMATYRSDELHRQHPLLPVLAEFERTGRVDRLDLSRFSRSELIEQMEGILGHQPDGIL